MTIVSKTFKMDENTEYKDSMNGFQRFIKRTFDIFFSFLGIIVLSPLYILIYLCFLFSGGKAIYSQERVGYKGKTFKIYKYRTMVRNAESNGQIPRSREERDEKLTKIGRVLRAHHLDELPQLWNVFVGDMSFVGPRPERQFFIDQINTVTSNYKYIYNMRPGLTSSATLYNGYTDTFEKMITRLEMDIEYYTIRSLWHDFKIIVVTVWKIVSGSKF